MQSVSDPTHTSLTCIKKSKPTCAAARRETLGNALASAPSRWLLWLPFVFATFASGQPASARINRSDAEIRQALLGTWQVDLTSRRFFPLKKSFITYRNNGQFAYMAIVEISGLDGRVELEGTWRVENGDLIERLTQAPHSSLIGLSERSTILSLEPARMTVRGKGGRVRLQRSSVPANLPPTSRWMVAMMASGDQKKHAVKTPQPSYPDEARKNAAEGRGIFRLLVDPGGDIRAVQVLQSTGHRVLDQAAVAGLKEWRFVPGKVNEYVVPVTFTMRGL